MKRINGKELAIDILIDFVGGFLIAVGIYNFAAKAQFPMTGFSGIALIFYHLFHIPIGAMTILLNIPVVFLCYKLLGRTFFSSFAKDNDHFFDIDGCGGTDAASI